MRDKSGSNDVRNLAGDCLKTGKMVFGRAGQSRGEPEHKALAIQVLLCKYSAAL